MPCKIKPLSKAAQKALCYQVSPYRGRMGEDEQPKIARRGIEENKKQAAGVENYSRKAC
jgi:hypothetical protein